VVNSIVAKFNKYTDLHQNPRFAKALGEIGWTILGKPGNYLFLKKIGPVGVAKIQHANLIDFDWLKNIRRKYHIFATYVEPGLLNKDIGKIGWPAEPFAYSATSIVDLTLSKRELLDSFKSKTRYNIGHTERKKELKIVTKDFHDLSPSDLSIFDKSRIAWSKRKGIFCYEGKFSNYLFKHFDRSGWMHFAYFENVCVGSLMILKNNQTAIYYAAFADKLGYSLFAPTLLTWTAMLTAKKAACQIFDFGGICDPRYKMYKKWAGFTRFKEGFSPTVVYYPPTRLLMGW